MGLPATITDFSFNWGPIAVPNTLTLLTALTTTPIWICGYNFTLVGDATMTLSLYNGAGVRVGQDIIVEPGILNPIPVNLEPLLGLKIQPSAVGIIGHIWGYV